MRGGVSELPILSTPHGAGGEVKGIKMYFSSRTGHEAGGVGEWKWMNWMNIPPPWLSLSQLSLQHWPGLFPTACSESEGLGQVPLLHSPQLCELDHGSVWVTAKDSANVRQSVCLGPYFLSYYLTMPLTRSKIRNISKTNKSKRSGKRQRVDAAHKGHLG